MRTPPDQRDQRRRQTDVGTDLGDRLECEFGRQCTEFNRQHEAARLTPGKRYADAGAHGEFSHAGRQQVAVGFAPGNVERDVRLPYVVFCAHWSPSMVPMPTINRRILIDDCDAAGVVFGPRIAALAHQAYEEVLIDVGVDLAALIRTGDIALPYVHLECEFRAPLQHGDLITIEVICGRIGTSSYTMHIDFFRDGPGGRESCARVSQTHVAIACATRAKIDLPVFIREALAALTVCPS